MTPKMPGLGIYLSDDDGSLASVECNTPRVLSNTAPMGQQKAKRLAKTRSTGTQTDISGGFVCPSGPPKPGDAQASVQADKVLGLHTVIARLQTRLKGYQQKKRECEQLLDVIARLRAEVLTRADHFVSSGPMPISGGSPVRRGKRSYASLALGHSPSQMRPTGPHKRSRSKCAFGDDWDAKTERDIMREVERVERDLLKGHNKQPAQRSAEVQP